MVRITTNITIVEMVDSTFRKSVNKTFIKSECIEIQNLILLNESTNFTTANFRGKISPEKLLLDKLQVKIQ